MVNSLQRAINARLLIHDEVFLTISCGRFRGVAEFDITRERSVAHPECIDDSWDDLTDKVIGTDAEMRSPHITYDVATKKFERWGASRMR